MAWVALVPFFFRQCVCGASFGRACLLRPPLLGYLHALKGYPQLTLVVVVVFADVSEMEVEFLPGPNGSRELGRGATGVVYLGKWKGQLVAVKQVQESLLMDDNPESAQYREEFIKEMEIMMSLDNDNILRFLGGCVGANYLITEYVKAVLHISWASNVN
jgi:hypothetical protein